MVVGYFSQGADAYRAINELIDEGFGSSEIGAAFRTRRMGAASVEGPASGEPKGTRDRNPAVTGSVGGAGSHDEAVTPAGLAPGSGAAFPAPGAKGPIVGAEIPSTLPHDLPSSLHSTLPSMLRSEHQSSSVPLGTVRATAVREGNGGGDEGWLDRLRTTYGEGETTTQTTGAKQERIGNRKFGTEEGRLGLNSGFEYSEPAFEGSFLGMGLGSTEARSLSSELSRGGAVVSVRAGVRSSLAEAILERNHGQIRIESNAARARETDRESPVEVYGSMRSWYQPEEGLRRKAS
jgi:hypothetical protein